ncbi:TPA: DUF551 domain-containing protein [Klebsiella pneumoniae]|uniref:DUF551 domain-containing protein n=1 Tax=Klebsiella pneumoniae TaxID=573 RepID=UPI0030EB4A5D|nr:DUF551 domain-containing protein [Klebsiella pneumoniae]
MTKSTITREQLLEIIETDHVQCGEASYLARMALAAMDSEAKEPISFDEWSRKCALQITLCYPDFREKAQYIWDSARETQQPAPVVPDGMERVATTLEHIGNFADAAIIRQLAANQQQNAPQNIPEIISGWIPVSDRMPEDRTQVILWDAEIGEVTSGHYSHKTHTFYHCGDAIENEITHWMAPPAAPQEVKGE